MIPESQLHFPKPNTISLCIGFAPRMDGSYLDLAILLVEDSLHPSSRGFAWHCIDCICVLKNLILYNPGLFSHLPIMFYEPAPLYMILGEPLISLTVTSWCFCVIEYCVIYIYWVFVWLSWCSMYGNVWYMLVILGVHVDTYIPSYSVHGAHG